MGTTHLGAPGPPGAPWWVVVPTWPPSLISLDHVITYLQKENLHCSLSRVLALKPTDFDLFARSSVSKTVSGVVAWYVTPSFVQLVFVLVIYTLNK